MTYKPSVISIDFETALADGSPSVEYYRPDFTVVGAAFAWRKADGTVGKVFRPDPESIRAQLERVPPGTVVVVHNYQFDASVVRHCFPGLTFQYVDTMRLAQVTDNGGKQMAYQPKVETYDEMLDRAEGLTTESTHRSGLSLTASASRFLPQELHNHKEPFHSWLREHKGVRKGQEGAHLTSLPPDMLEAYNVADAEVTLYLYETLTARLESEGYDWRLDHQLYQSTAGMVADAKAVGVGVDTVALEAYASQVQAEIDAIENQFRTRFAKEIEQLETGKHNAWIESAKRYDAMVRRAGHAPERFNQSSGKQLAGLFCEVLGIKPRFWTKEPKAKSGKARKKPFAPQPSFKSAHLSSYGEGGEILRARRKRLLVLQQTKSLLKLAAHDGRWHPDLRAAGTATGRLAGGRG